MTENANRKPNSQDDLPTVQQSNSGNFMNYCARIDLTENIADVNAFTHLVIREVEKRHRVRLSLELSLFVLSTLLGGILQVSGAIDWVLHNVFSLLIIKV